MSPRNSNFRVADDTDIIWESYDRQCNMPVRTMVSLFYFLSLVPYMAQQPRIPNIEAQRTAMKKLEFMVGVGRGGPSPTRTRRSGFIDTDGGRTIQARRTDPIGRGNRADQGRWQASSSGPRDHLLRRRERNLSNARV